MKVSISFVVDVPDDWNFYDENNFSYLVQRYANYLACYGYNFRNELDKYKIKNRSK